MTPSTRTSEAARESVAAPWRTRQARGVSSLRLQVLACAVLALWADFGRFHFGHAGDSLLPVLISTQHWTPFFWEQNRFGMLVPLLAYLIRNPLWNLLFQCWVMLFAALMASVLLSRYLFRAANWTVAALTSALMLVVLAPKIDTRGPSAQFDWINTQPYALGFSLGLAAMLVMQSKANRLKRWSVALGLGLLAHWVNASTAVVLGPLVVLQWASGVRRRAWQQFVVLISTMAVGLVFMHFAQYSTTKVGIISPRGWVPALSQWFGNVQSALHWNVAVCVTLVAAAMVAAITIAAGSSPWREQARAAVVASTVGVAFYLYFGITSWAATNAYSPRYGIPSFFLFAFTAATVISIAMEKAFRGNSSAVAVCASVVLLTLFAVQFAVPRPGRPRVELDGCCGRYTQDVIASGATLFAGEYWNVWPAVFHANMVLYEQGSTRQVYALSHRSYPAHSLWQSMSRDEIRICGVWNDGDVVRYMRERLALPVREEPRHGDLRVFQVDAKHALRLDSNGERKE